MKLVSRHIVSALCLIVCFESQDLSAQRMEQDSTKRFMISGSFFSFAGRFPSVQGGVYYRLDDKSAIDAEGSYLLPQRSVQQVNYNIGFIAKGGYLRRIFDSKNFLATRLYLRSNQHVGREEFTRYGGEYIERIDFRTVTNLAGMTLGWVRHSSHDLCDFQFGISYGLGKLFTSGELPQDAQLIRTGWRSWEEPDLEQPKGLERIFYVDFKLLF